jgi:hypothetical protein
MKLAEALLERKNLKQKIESLSRRAEQYALVQEGDAPQEASVDLLRELDGVAAELAVLIKRINATNMTAHLEDGPTIADAIVNRDMLDLRFEAVNETVEATTSQRNRYTRNEIKYVVTVNVPELRREADALARERRDLDARIQAANWTIDLLDLL